MDLRESIDGLLSEIKVNKPINKKQLLDRLINEQTYLLSILTNSSTFDGFLNDRGFNTISEFLEEEDYDEIYSELIISYYKIFKPGEVICTYFSGDEREDFKLDSSYKNLIIQPGDDNYVILHNI